MLSSRRLYHRLAPLCHSLHGSRNHSSSSFLIPAPLQLSSVSQRPLPLSLRRTCCSDNHSNPSHHHQNKDSSLYVSKHFSLRGEQVVEYLRQRRITFRLSKNVAIIKECMFCHDTRNLPDNQYKLHVFRDSGAFNCFRCKTKGSWYQFRHAISHGSPSSDISNTTVNNDIDRNQLEQHQPQPLSISTAKKSSSPQRPTDNDLRKKQHALWNDPSLSSVRHYLCQTRGLTEQTLRHFGLGACKMRVHVPSDNSTDGNDNDQWRVDDCIAFPMYDSDGKLARYKMRSIRTKSGMKLYPSGGDWGLFGLNTVPQNAREIVLTEGELDAMSVWQGTGRHAVSLPNGASSLPVPVLPCLERFERVYLWMDFDEAGRAGAKQFARKLGARRVLIIPENKKLSTSTTNKKNQNQKNAMKDANDVLRNGYENMDEFFHRASPVAHDGVIRFDDMRESVYEHIIAGSSMRRGIQCQSIPRLNDLLKGHRRGELTILSGHTGIGKTTLLSQLSLDYCMQGVVTMWGSFEIPTAKLAAGLLMQMHGAMGGYGNLQKDYDVWADRLAELPLLFMKYHGSNSIDMLMDAMEYGNYVHDCTHFVLDNLQFMTYGQSVNTTIPTSSSPSLSSPADMNRYASAAASAITASSTNSSNHNSTKYSNNVNYSRRVVTDRFEVMNEAVSRLRGMCTRDNVHVTLVVHPRKESDDERIQLASVFGSAKATQEADNVLLLQRGKDGTAQLEVKKNRFDGQCGKVNLWFDKKSKLFCEGDRERCRMEMKVGGARMQVINDPEEGENEMAITADVDVNVEDQEATVDKTTDGDVVNDMRKPEEAHNDTKSPLARQRVETKPSLITCQISNKKRDQKQREDTPHQRSKRRLGLSGIFK